MAGRRPTRPHAVPLAQTPAVSDPHTQRALDVLTSAVHDLQSRNTAAAVVVSGSRSSGAALADLLEKLATLGIIVDETTA